MSKLVVLGAGESGTGAAILAKERGWEVFASDNGPIAPEYRAMLAAHHIAFEERGHTLAKILDASEAVKSPGIPDSAPVVRELRARGVPVVSEIEFAGRYVGGARTICVTGSNGKTTTTTLIHRILHDAGFDAALAGNIGDSFALSVARGSHAWYVLELSSFQLDGMSEFRADIAVLTNITPDHLDRYEHKMENYVRSKMGVTRNQRPQDSFIYFADDPVVRQALGECRLGMTLLPFTCGRGVGTEVEGGAVPSGLRAMGEGAATGHAPLEGAFTEGDRMVAVVGRQRFTIPLCELRIKGRHNICNAMAAVLAALAAGVAHESIRSTLRNFEGVEHRLEYAGTVGGAQYINDSKATNVDSALVALESMTSPVVWIAGGTDKGNDYAALEPLVREKVRALVCMGVDNTKLLAAFRGVVPVVREARSLAGAMAAARELAQPGDTVLLSPACASFDLFRNYEDRGEQFKQWVAEHG